MWYVAQPITNRVQHIHLRLGLSLSVGQAYSSRQQLPNRTSLYSHCTDEIPFMVSGTVSATRLVNQKRPGRDINQACQSSINQSSHLLLQYPYLCLCLAKKWSERKFHLCWLSRCVLIPNANFQSASFSLVILYFLLYLCCLRVDLIFIHLPLPRPVPPKCTAQSIEIHHSSAWRILFPHPGSCVCNHIAIAIPIAHQSSLECGKVPADGKRWWKWYENAPNGAKWWKCARMSVYRTGKRWLSAPQRTKMQIDKTSTKTSTG